MGFIRLERTWARCPQTPGIFGGISPVSNGTCLRFPIIHILELPGETESGSAHDASETRDIQAPVRPWHVRPLTANAVGGRFFPPMGHRPHAL